VSLLRHIASELAGEQREQLEALGITIKNAREMALLPYSSRPGQ
jgi:ribosomal protein S18